MVERSVRNVKDERKGKYLERLQKHFTDNEGPTAGADAECLSRHPQTKGAVKMQIPSPFKHVAVVGMHFRGPEVKAMVSNFVPPVGLLLEREPHNPYDSMAIKVLYDTDSGPLHIGYVERERAAFIAPYMDNGIAFTCTCVDMEARKNNLHPICNIVPIEPASDAAFNEAYSDAESQ